MNVPEQINTKGSNGDFDTVVVEVRICRNRKDGTVWSLHDLQDSTDQNLVQKWPGWGIQPISSAMLLEAVRRSAYVMVLSYVSHTNPKFLLEYKESSGGKRGEMEALISTLLEDVLGRSVKRIGLSSVQEILAMMEPQIQPPGPTPG